MFINMIGSTTAQ